MLSGIGPAEELKAVGVKPVLDLPGVGSNLQDHPAVCKSTFVFHRHAILQSSPSSYRPLAFDTTYTVIAHDITKKISVTDVLFTRKSIMKPQHILRWLISGKGPLTTPGCDHGAFLRTRPDVSEPDLQVRVLPFMWTESRPSLSICCRFSFPDLTLSICCIITQLRFVAGRGSGPDGVKSYIRIGAAGQVTLLLNLRCI